MEAGQPQKGGQVLPQVVQAGHDPVISRHTHILPLHLSPSWLVSPERYSIFILGRRSLPHSAFVHHGQDMRTRRAVQYCCGGMVFGFLCAVPCIIASGDALDLDIFLRALRCQPSRKENSKNCPASCPRRAAKDRVVPAHWTGKMGRTDHHPTFHEPAVQQPIFQVLEARVASTHSYPSKGLEAVQSQLYRTNKRRASNRLMAAVEV
jgi:hypothetical protein